MNIRDLIEDKGIFIIEKPLGPGLRGSTFSKNGKWFIIVNENDPPERRNFTIAHEYGEILLNDDPELSNDEKHHQANKLASEFLLPEETFGKAVFEMDLYELKAAFPDASYEVIARRIPSFISSVISIFDNERLTARFGSDNINFPSLVSPLEMRAVRQCYMNGSKITIEEYPVCVRCYSLEEMNCIKRVIAVAEIDEYA